MKSLLQVVILSAAKDLAVDDNARREPLIRQRKTADCGESSFSSAQTDTMLRFARDHTRAGGNSKGIKEGMNQKRQLIRAT